MRSRFSTVIHAISRCEYTVGTANRRKVFIGMCTSEPSISLAMVGALCLEVVFLMSHSCHTTGSTTPPIHASPHRYAIVFTGVWLRGFAREADL